MAEQSGWLGRLRTVVEREYERRIRAASLVTEYGAAHGSHHSHDDDEGDAAEIMNLPRGARRPTPHHEDASVDPHDH
ncbi:hypothetical protein EKD04_003380 [Chloroflexales bacterium ZM16-3]|nr:hypothetical protein [Chloroflexales bacterium ZM16-3]